VNLYFTIKGDYKQQKGDTGDYVPVPALSVVLQNGNAISF